MELSTPRRMVTYERFTRLAMASVKPVCVAVRAKSFARRAIANSVDASGRASSPLTEKDTKDGLASATQATLRVP